jgi:hypothetical protein
MRINPGHNRVRVSRWNIQPESTRSPTAVAVTAVKRASFIGGLLSADAGRSGHGPPGESFLIY